ncbi:hypothetical protein BGZ92_011802, partial [Podila epicladia]
MSHYGQQQQGYSGQYNNAGYDNSGAYPPQQQQDPSYGTGSAPPYSAYPVAGGMGPSGYSSTGGGYPGSPGFNPSVVNYNNSNLSHSSSHNSQYNNGPMNGAYDASSNNNINSNSNSNEYGQHYQSGGLNYQQSIYNPPPHQHQNQNQSQNQTYNQGQQQPGMSPAINNTPAPLSDRAQAPQPEGDYPVVMAIDFGTTFSGVAYALKADGEVHDMIKWPRHLAQYPKTPTLSLYKKDSQKILDWGHAARLAMLKPSAKDFCLLRKFKLQLDESIHQAPLENGISALEAVTHYLKKLHGHVMAELMKGFIKNYEPSQFQYCLTVPAMWSDSAKNTMRRAAIGAGLIQEGDPPNRLILISEPEAAAMYCERMVDRFSLKHGDRFMICDAGGGTVDLIVFEVSEPPGQARHLKEVTRGHGASCGSVFLDANMERLLERKFKRYRRGIKACGWASLMDTFVDMVKPMFNGQEDVLMQIPQATGLEDLNDPEIGLEDGVLCVSVEEMKTEVFEPVISDVLDLIHKQLHQSQNCSAIFM